MQNTQVVLVFHSFENLRNTSSLRISFFFFWLKKSAHVKMTDDIVHFVNIMKLMLTFMFKEMFLEN